MTSKKVKDHDTTKVITFIFYINMNGKVFVVAFTKSLSKKNAL